MIKNIILLSLIFLGISCNDVNQTESLITEIEILKAENDSLKGLLDEVKNKYVFDKISYREIPSKSNTGTLNSNYETEIIIVGYNSKQDSIMEFPEIEDNGRVYNSYQIMHKKGGIKFKTKLDKPENWIRFEINSKNKFGKEITSFAIDKIKVKN